MREIIVRYNTVLLPPKPTLSLAAHYCSGSRPPVEWNPLARHRPAKCRRAPTRRRVENSSESSLIKRWATGSSASLCNTESRAIARARRAAIRRNVEKGGINAIAITRNLG